MTNPTYITYFINENFQKAQKNANIFLSLIQEIHHYIFMLQLIKIHQIYGVLWCFYDRIMVLPSFWLFIGFSINEKTTSNFIKSCLYKKMSRFDVFTTILIYSGRTSKKTSMTKSRHFTEFHDNLYIELYKLLIAANGSKTCYFSINGIHQNNFNYILQFFYITEITTTKNKCYPISVARVFFSCIKIQLYLTQSYFYMIYNCQFIYKQNISLFMSSHNRKPSLIRLQTRQAQRNMNGKISLRQSSFYNLKKQNSQSLSNFADLNPPPTASSIQSNSIKNSEIEIRNSYHNICQGTKEAISERTQTNSCHKFSLKNTRSYLKESGFISPHDNSKLRLGFSNLILNLKYCDIVYKKKSLNMLQFAKDLCTTNKGFIKQQPAHFKSPGIIPLFEFGKKKTTHYGCKCQVKCLTIDRWLQQERLYIPKEKKYDKKAHQRYLTQIQKDMRRTQPYESTFQCDTYLFRLKETLAAYAKLDPQVGYVQGMNFIASIFVYHAPDLNTCIRLMDLLFIKKNYRSIYAHDFQQCKKHSQTIVNLLQKKCSEMHYFFVHKHQIYLQIFVQGWMFTLLGNIIPIEYMYLTIDLFMKQSFRGIYKIICTLILYMYQKKQLKILDDATDVMQMLSVQSLTKCGIDWEQLLLTSHQFPINQKQVARKEGHFIILK